MLPLRHFIFALTLLCFGFNADDAVVQVTINWPPDTLGNYLLQGGVTTKPSTESGTYAVEEGKGERLVGRGFDINFNNKNGFKLLVSNLHPRVTEDDVLVIIWIIHKKIIK